MTYVQRSLWLVAKNWLIGQTRSAIFVSSIEMANSPALHAVIFRSGEVVCAAPAGIVREILPRLPATRIPGVPDEVEGLVNVRGTLLTVLDGHLLLQQERRSSDEGAIVVLEVRGSNGASSRVSTLAWSRQWDSRLTATSSYSTSKPLSRRSSEAKGRGL